MKSIQTKFIVLILGCVLLTALMIGGAGILSAQQVMEEESEQVMNLLCREKAQSIDATLSRIEQSVNTLAAYALEQLKDIKQFKTSKSYMESFSNQMQEVAVNAANNTEGALAVYLRYNPAFGDPSGGLFWNRLAQNQVFTQLRPTDLSKYDPTDFERVGWYYLPVQNKKATWLTPYMNKNINVQMISYVVPIFKNGETIGVVGMDIEFALIAQIVEGIRVYDTGYAFLTDEKANIMHHKSLEMGKPMEELEPSLKPVAQELRQGGKGSFLFAYNWRGERKKMALSSLRNDMRLVITATVSEIEQGKTLLVHQTGGATLLVVGVSLLLTILMTRRIVRPLKQLNLAAKKIAQGDLTMDIPYKSKDEVGTLANSFAQTALHLKDHIAYIQGLAYKDALTGVKNRTAYQEAAARMDQQIKEAKPQFAVLVMDINHLKQFNDIHGHDFGDIMIIDCSKLICKSFQNSPVFRVGGDEFVVLLEKDDYQNYPQLLVEFEAATRACNQQAIQATYISIAKGIAVYDAAVDDCLQSVFIRADDAMYQNKIQMKAKLLEENKNLP